MKKLFLTVLWIACSLSVQAEDRQQVLRVANWVDYIDLDLIPEFEEWYHRTTGEKIRVDYNTYTMPDTMYYQVANEHFDYDVCCPPEYLVERMMRHNLLQPIDTVDFLSRGVPNWMKGTAAFLDEAIQRYGDIYNVNSKTYAVPFQWGTTSVVYNTKYVSREDVESWDFLFNSKFKGKIRIKDAFSDLFTILTLYGGYKDVQEGRITRDQLAGNLTNENLAIIRDLLERMRPQIVGWEFDDGKERMASGEDWLAVTWNGDAQWALGHAAPDVKLDVIVPKEGSDLWVDCWVIPSYAANVKAASYWINYMCKYEHAIRCMKVTNWPSAIATPEILEALTDTTLTETIDLSYFFGPEGREAHIDPLLYSFPPHSDVKRLAIMRDVGDRMEDVRDIWDQIKNSGIHHKTVSWLWGVVILLVVLTLLFFWWRNRRK
jgi:spermidine/putrescine transport system substrate-binding protein